MSKLKKDQIYLRMFSHTGETFFDISFCEVEIFRDLYAEGVRLCQEYIPGGSDFFLVDSFQRQAVAIQDLSVVMVYKGLLDVVFGIASLAAATTPVPKGTADGSIFPWRENVDSWLLQDSFDWDNERYWWLKSPEHRTVFDFYVRNLFRFIVLHEIGHMHNMHALRRAIRGNESAEVDQQKNQAKVNSVEKEWGIHKIESEPDEGESRLRGTRAR